MARPKAITSLKDSDPKGKRNWMIYADSGEGKTVLAGTAPNALFLVTEAAGTESAKAMGSTADEWVCDTYDEFMKAYNYVKNEGHKEYEWCLVDSSSEMEELMWLDQLQKGKKKNKARNEFQPALADYQIIGNKVKNMVDSFNRLPINVLYTAQTMRLDIEDDEDDGEDTTKLMPLLGSPNNGVISQKVCGKVTLIGLLQARPGKGDDMSRRLWLQGGKRYIAKDRHDAFPRYLDNPTIEAMAKTVDARQAGQEKAATVKASKKKKEN